MPNSVVYVVFLGLEENAVRGNHIGRRFDKIGMPAFDWRIIGERMIGLVLNNFRLGDLARPFGAAGVPVNPAVTGRHWEVNRGEGVCTTFLARGSGVVDWFVTTT